VHYFSQLASELDLGEYGSRLTVLDGKDATAFITDAISATDVNINFNESAYNTRKFLSFSQIPIFSLCKSIVKGRLL
jgi:hypothetical protein